MKKTIKNKHFFAGTFYIVFLFFTFPMSQLSSLAQTVNFVTTVPGVFSSQPAPSHLNGNGDQLSSQAEVFIGSFGTESNGNFQPIDPRSLGSVSDLEANFVDMFSASFTSLNNFSEEYQYPVNRGLEDTLLLQGQDIYAFGKDLSDPSNPQYLLIEYDESFPALGATGPGINLSVFDEDTINEVLIGAINLNFADPNLTDLNILSGTMFGLEGEVPTDLFEIIFFGTTVPEPSSSFFCLLSGCLLLFRRKR